MLFPHLSVISLDIGAGDAPIGRVVSSPALSLAMPNATLMRVHACEFVRGGFVIFSESAVSEISRLTRKRAGDMYKTGHTHTENRGREAAR